MSAAANSPLEKFTRGVVITALGASAICLGFIAWLQHEELAALRAQITEYQQHPSSGKKNRQTTDESAAPGDVALDDSADPNSPNNSSSKGHKEKLRADGSVKPRTKETSGWRAYANMAGNPEFEKLSASQARAQAGHIYAPLMKSLNLSSDSQARLQELLGARQQAMTDAVVAARENGLKSKTAPAEISRATADATAPIDAQIQALLGNAGFGEFQQFQAAIPEQNLVAQLQQRLATTSTPLRDERAAQLLQMLAQTKSADGSIPGTRSLLEGGGVAKVTDATLSVAQQVLTPPQVQALVQIQQERQVQSELEKVMKGKPVGVPPKTPGKE